MRKRRKANSHYLDLSLRNTPENVCVNKSIIKNLIVFHESPLSLCVQSLEVDHADKERLFGKMPRESCFP